MNQVTVLTVLFMFVHLARVQDYDDYTYDEECKLMVVIVYSLILNEQYNKLHTVKSFNYRPPSL